MSGSNVATTNFTLRAHFKAEQRHFRERERFLRRQRDNPHRVTHVAPERGVMLLGYGKRNTTVRAIHAMARERITVKQPGRRYGPPPLSGNPGAQAGPMSLARRVQAYKRQIGSTGRLTPHQRRQIERMGGLGEDA